MATSADDYLGSLRETASLESSGSFTLDTQKARETLQRFQLPSADHYLLPLVACAVSGGADSFSHYRKNQRWLSDLSGLAVDLESSSQARSYLELALTTAARIPEAIVSGASWDGEKGWQFGLQRGQLSITPLSQAPWPNSTPQTRLGLQPPHPWLASLSGAVRWLAGLGPSPDRATQLLKAYARYSPLPIRLQGTQINLQRQGSWKLLALLNHPPLQLRPLGSLIQVSLQKDVSFSGYLGLGVGGGGALVVVDGLLYPLEIPEFPPDFRAVLWHKGLQRDLSLLKLVENQQLQQLRQELKELLQAITTSQLGPRRPGQTPA